GGCPPNQSMSGHLPKGLIPDMAGKSWTLDNVESGFHTLYSAHSGEEEWKFPQNANQWYLGLHTLQVTYASALHIPSSLSSMLIRTRGLIGAQRGAGGSPELLTGGPEIFSRLRAILPGKILLDLRPSSGRRRVSIGKSSALPAAPIGSPNRTGRTTCIVSPLPKARGIFDSETYPGTTRSGTAQRGRPRDPDSPLEFKSGPPTPLPPDQNYVGPRELEYLAAFETVKGLLQVSKGAPSYQLPILNPGRQPMPPPYEGHFADDTVEQALCLRIEPTWDYNTTNGIWCLNLFKRAILDGVKAAGQRTVNWTKVQTIRELLTLGPLLAEHTFLLTSSPVNLLGRDLLCKLNATIKCSEDGIYLYMPEDSVPAFQGMVLEEKLDRQFPELPPELENELPPSLNPPQKEPQSVVGNPNSLLNAIPAGTTWYSAADLCSAFFNDILLCSTSEEACKLDTKYLLSELARKGHKVSPKKLQYCKQEAVTRIPSLRLSGNYAASLDSPSKSLGSKISENPPPTDSLGKMEINRPRYEVLATASVVARALLQDIIPRYGIPRRLDSDRGTHFTAEVSSGQVEQLDVGEAELTNYIIQLQTQLLRLHQYAAIEGQNLPIDVHAHSFHPGDWILVKVYQKAPLQPAWEGPYQVLLTSPTAVKVGEKNAWLHHTRCKTSPPPQETLENPEEDYAYETPPHSPATYIDDDEEQTGPDRGQDRAQQTGPDRGQDRAQQTGPDRGQDRAQQTGPDRGQVRAQQTGPDQSQVPTQHARPDVTAPNWTSEIVPDSNAIKLRLKCL
ncbi:protein NYNRIN-like, partial [Podarcis lilfordi]